MGNGNQSMPLTLGHVQMPGVMRSGDPRDMAKAELPEPQSPAMQVFIHRKGHLKPVPRSAPCYLVAGCNLQSAGRYPVRIFKGMSGAPKSRCYVRQGRTWDRLRGASPMATELLVIVAGVASCQGDGSTVHRAKEHR